MSQYANYTLASEDYDATRVSVGSDTILDCLARTGVPLKEQTVLEAGCGTGTTCKYYARIWEVLPVLTSAKACWHKPVRNSVRMWS